MMHYKSLELTNYIGIANGLGTHKIFIDFTKCKNRIIVILGDNGSGKSTIFKSLQLLPDNSDMFIPDTNAIKVIEIVDDDTNNTYKIRYEHYAKKDKGYTTKGYIYKIMPDGTMLNMNEQGTITMCKDIIYSELNLDANFMALSQLSENDKGLASKTPAERKKIASSIIQSIEVYNAIHKTISKRASIFKSMINATASKIQHIGDENLLKTSLTSISNRLNMMVQKKEEEIEALGSHKSNINRLDPTGSIQESYKVINNLISELLNQKSIMDKKITMILKESNLSQVTSDLHMKIQEHILSLESKINSIETNINKAITDRESESNDLQNKISKMNSLKSETNYLELKSLYNEYSTKINEYEGFFKEIGLRDYNLTKDEYIIGLNSLKDIKETVDVFKEAIDYNTMQITLSKYIPTNSYPDKDTLLDAISGLELYVTECKEKLIYFNAQLGITKNLLLRPSGCNIDSCDFIKDAIEATKEEPEKNIEFLESEITSTEIIIADKYKELEMTESIIKCINYFKVLFRNIDSYSSILNKLPNGDIFSNKDIFISKLVSGSTFEEINNIYPYITKASIMEDYNNISKAIIEVRNDLKIYESKNTLIVEIQKDIDSLSRKVNTLTEYLNDSEKTRYQLKTELDVYTHKAHDIKMALELITSITSIDSDILEQQNNLKTIENAISSIQSSLMQIDVINKRLRSIQVDISKLETEKSDIEHSLRLLSEYKAEIEMYSDKYEKINTIKYYSSYNTGIQTIFMELYMHKVNQIANQLLSSVLGGKFHFKKWIINETEFRIPCLGDGGYLNDDISSLSGGESAIISVIISFSLLYQASSKYNIPKLDEIDATLDTVNRRQFPIMLESLMDIINAKQSIIISHNNEYDLYNSDIILLRMSDVNKYNDIVSSGNVIFDYKNN